MTKNSWPAMRLPLRPPFTSDDMYVDSGMRSSTPLSRVGNSHYWTTNEFEHDGLQRLARLQAPLHRKPSTEGDLEELF